MLPHHLAPPALKIHPAVLLRIGVFLLGVPEFPPAEVEDNQVQWSGKRGRPRKAEADLVPTEKRRKALLQPKRGDLQTSGFSVEILNGSAYTHAVTSIFRSQLPEAEFEIATLQRDSSIKCCLKASFARQVKETLRHVEQEREARTWPTKQI